MLALFCALISSTLQPTHELDGDSAQTPDVGWRPMGQPCRDLWCKLSACQVEALRHLKTVILQAKSEVKARDLQLDALVKFLASIVSPVFSHEGLCNDILKADVSMNDAFLVETLKGFCKLLDTLDNIINLDRLVRTEAVNEV